MWEKKCPILRLRTHLEENKLWDTQKEDELQKQIKAQVDAAIEKAKNTEKPDLHTLFEDVYCEIPKSLEEQYQQLRGLQ